MANFRVHRGDDIDVVLGVQHLISRRHHRDEQQDAALSSTHLAAVADGMGGHPDGAAAAVAALDALGAAVTGPGSADDLLAGFAAAQIAVAALGNPEWWRNPGAAAVAVLADPDGSTVHGAWIGDARIYGVNTSGDVQLLTEDHAGSDGGLTAALGDHRDYGGNFGRVDTFTLPATAFDLLLLSSDGFHGPLEATGGLESIATPVELRALVDAAETGRDNITVLALDPTYLRAG